MGKQGSDAARSVRDGWPVGKGCEQQCAFQPRKTKPNARRPLPQPTPGGSPTPGGRLTPGSRNGSGIPLGAAVPFVAGGGAGTPACWWATFGTRGTRGARLMLSRAVSRCPQSPSLRTPQYTSRSCTAPADRTVRARRRVCVGAKRRAAHLGTGIRPLARSLRMPAPRWSASDRGGLPAPVAVPATVRRTATPVARKPLHAHDAGLEVFAPKARRDLLQNRGGIAAAGGVDVGGVDVAVQAVQRALRHAGPERHLAQQHVDHLAPATPTHRRQPSPCLSQAPAAQPVDLHPERLGACLPVAAEQPPVAVILGDLAAAVGELGHLRRRHRRLAVTPEHHAEAVSLKILQRQTNSFSDRICAKGHGRDLLRT